MSDIDMGELAKSLEAPGPDLENRFTHHPPFGSQPDRYKTIRRIALGLADLIDGACPPSREKSLAFTKLEEAVMWANASIARNESPGPLDDQFES